MSQDSRKILAYNVKRLRENFKIRKEKLSLRLGFDNSYISKLEKEKVNITLDKIEKIADYFNVDIKDLFTFEE